MASGSYDKYNCTLKRLSSGGHTYPFSQVSTCTVSPGAGGTGGLIPILCPSTCHHPNQIYRLRDVQSAGHTVSVAGQKVSPAGHVVSATGQTVVSIGHSVATAGQLVAACGHSVTTQTVGSAGHSVVTAGHSVATAGQLVAATGHSVATAGHVVATSGHTVTACGHSVTTQTVDPWDTRLPLQDSW